MSRVLLIIDPFLKEPAFQAINLISKIHNEVIEKLKIDSRIELFFPSHSSKSLSDYISQIDVKDRLIGVISLGSYANVGDNLDWVNEYGKDLKDKIIEKGIPFFGICFSHQLLAWVYGANVDYVQGRENLPDRKYNEFRQIKISHSKIEKIYKNKLTFISKAKHEQEVKSIPAELELGGSSINCNVEILIHKTLPAFSVQSHPEELHDSKDGYYLIQNVIEFFLNWKGSWDNFL